MSRTRRTFLELTGSPRAADLLARWQSVRGRFVRVSPRGMKVQMPQAWLELRERVADWHTAQQ